MGLSLLSRPLGDVERSNTSDWIFRSRSLPVTGRLFWCRRTASIIAGDWLEWQDRKMAASPSVVPVVVTAAVGPVLSASSDFSNLREIKKQLLLIAGLTRERGLLHSSKWWDVGVGRDWTWILGLWGCGSNSVWVFQVRGVGLLPPRLASGGAAAAAAYYRGKDIITADAPYQPEELHRVLCRWMEAYCLSGTIVKGIQAFKELDVLSDLIGVGLSIFVKIWWCFT